ncbi:MAG: hypothetical protein JWM27_641 [Gemmatimonadetes bacterium]|nr:hypothetical protein [Gemmatimonadota bacterium]
MSAPADPRAIRATDLLARRGFDGATVTVSGHEGEIAALRVPADAWDGVAGAEGLPLARELKALGFRYVALDLVPSDG